MADLAQNITEQAEEKIYRKNISCTEGTGKITINKRDIDEYLGLETLKTSFVSRWQQRQLVGRCLSLTFAAAGSDRQALSVMVSQSSASRRHRVPSIKSWFLNQEIRVKEKPRSQSSSSRSQFSKDNQTVDYIKRVYKTWKIKVFRVFLYLNGLI